MNEEEKEAIELLKQEPDFSLSYYKREHAIDIVLNLIEKQQKEIKKLEKENNKLTKLLLGKSLGFNDYISKDKIRKLKEYYEDSLKYAENEIESNNIYVSIKILEKLLEE